MASTTRWRHATTGLLPLLTGSYSMTGRRWACAGATGQVLEVAIGTGRNLFFYPPDAQLTGVDLSPRMLDRARTRAETLTRPVDLQLGDAQHLAFPDASFDTVVATLTVCSIPDGQAAVAEMARVLRPGGRLALLDHVASTSSPVRAVQQQLGGCHTGQPQPTELTCAVGPRWVSALSPGDSKTDPPPARAARGHQPQCRPLTMRGRA